MKIAIIGTGRIGRSLGDVWSALGHAVVYGSREGQTGGGISAESASQPVLTIADAAAFCEVALLAIPWYAFTDIERALGQTLDGKVIIDCINPFMSSGSLALGHKRSAGEEIQKALPGSFVVKAFNHLPRSAFREPQLGGQAATAFYCSNFDDAKDVVVQLATEMGLQPCDAGPIKNARLLEPLAALRTQLAYVTHHGDEIAFRLLLRDVA